MKPHADDNRNANPDQRFTASVWPRPSREPWLVLLLALLIGLSLQGSRPLWDPDEGRYTDVAHQMLASGDWLVPHLGPERPHLSKPPLTYWALAASFATFGNNEWAARLPNALAFALTSLLVLGLARKLQLARPLTAALVWMTLLGPVIAANVVTTDTLLAMTETLALYGFAAAGMVSAVQAPRRAGLRLMWLGFALAFLVKGPPGLLPLLACIAFLAWRRRDQLARLFDPLGLLLFALLGLSWYLVLIWKTPEAFDYFIRHELIGRVATAEHHRNAGWLGWVAVYVPTLLVGCLPWLAVAAWIRFRGRQRVPAMPTDVHRFLWMWCAVPFAILALSQSRLPLYVLPLFVPMALLLSGPISAMTDKVLLRVTLLAVLLAIGVRLGGALVHGDGDAQVLAAELQRTAQLDRIQEIVFVDVPGRYGLRHYLGINVAEAASGMAGRSGPAFAAPLAMCDAAKRPHRLLLLSTQHLERTGPELAACAPHARRLGTLRRWALFESGGPDRSNGPISW